MSSRTIASLMAAAVVAATARGATVDGYCYLEGQTCHCLTKVELDESDLHLPKYTDCSGYFGPFVLVAPGWHTLTYTHAEYESRTLVVYVPAMGITVPPITLETKALCDPESWKDYPYPLPGNPPIPIIMPYDEGKHDPTSTYRIEWWYVNFHLTAEDNTEYAGIVSFFKPPLLGSPGLVLFSVTDLDSCIKYSGARYPLVCNAADDWFDLDFGLPPLRDRWYNRQCEGYFLPFEYHLSMDWLEEGIGWLELDMGSLKPPMPVGGDGYVEFGEQAWSYYYSHPRVDILGTLHLPGFPPLGKDVQGYGWIDHQWANLPTELITWEWLSMQLDNLREIMVADVWIAGEQQGSFSGGLNYYDETCGLDVLEDYDITRLRCWYDAEHDRTYATQWRVAEPSRQIDLIVTAVCEHSVLETTGEIIGAAFWEGPCVVSGSIEGQPVTGTAFGELTHWWDGLPEACCADNGECWYVPPGLCIEQGGTPQGAGTTCETIPPCPRPCCLPDGSCEVLSPNDCVAQGGSSQEPGVYCEAEEACCLEQGECVMLAPVCCYDWGGIPQGPGSDCDPNPCEGACCPEGPFGDGADGDYTVPPDPAYITADKNFHNLTVLEGATFDTRGHTVRVCGVLSNRGIITDTVSGGSGGNGGAGGKGGNPKGAPSDPTDCGRVDENCTNGQTGQPGSGRSGDGGGGGGGGGGAWCDFSLCEADADGGNGGAGGHGGHGGGNVLIYAYRFENQGVIHADGQDGEPGSDAPPGDENDMDNPHGYEECGAEYFHYECIGHKDLAGGGGGGGAGGDGGNGGLVEVRYGILLNQGILRADAGQGASGGLGGSFGGYLYHGVNIGGHDNGCPGIGGGGDGGRGAHEGGDSSEPGENGADGADGQDGDVDLIAVDFSDCNNNSFPDECDIFHGFSEDCQANGVPDECDVDPTDPDGNGEVSPDCNGNLVPDECDLTGNDCQPNGVPDECDIDPTDPDGNGEVSQDGNGNGVPDECERCPGPGSSGRYCTADVWPNNGDGVWDFGDDGDCVVDLSDLSQLLANYGCVDCTHEDGDVWPENGDGIWEAGADGDGLVDLRDLAELLGQYNDACN